MLSSANYVRDEKVLQTGEQIAPDLDFKDPNLKVYYHQSRGARTHMPDGAEIVFQGGQFSTANPEIIAYLDKLANKPGTMVYTKDAAKINQEIAQVAEDAAAPAGDADKKNLPVREETMKTVTAVHPRPQALPEKK